MSLDSEYIREQKGIKNPWEKDMIPSKYEGSILEDDIVEEPFKIEVGANMKTLEQLVIDAIAPVLCYIRACIVGRIYGC